MDYVESGCGHSMACMAPAKGGESFDFIAAALGIASTTVLRLPEPGAPALQRLSGPLKLLGTLTRRHGGRNWAYDGRKMGSSSFFNQSPAANQPIRGR